MAISVLFNGTSREIEAIPIIFSRRAPDYNTLLFLCQKHNKLGELLEILTMMCKYGLKDEEASNLINRLQTTGVKKTSLINPQSLEKKMRDYNAG